MKDAETLYLSICQQINQAEQSQFFGKPCFKIGNKAFVSFFENEMVFKLNAPAHQTAMGLQGAHLFDPSGKGRAMKQWVQVPFKHQQHWPQLAANACDYVASLLK